MIQMSDISFDLSELPSEILSYMALRCNTITPMIEAAEAMIVCQPTIAGHDIDWSDRYGWVTLTHIEFDLLTAALRGAIVEEMQRRVKE